MFQNATQLPAFFASSLPKGRKQLLPAAVIFILVNADFNCWVGAKLCSGEKRSLKMALYCFQRYCIRMYGRNWFGCYIFLCLSQVLERVVLIRKRRKEKCSWDALAFCHLWVKWMPLNPEVLTMRRKLLASYHQTGGLKPHRTLGVRDSTSPCVGFLLWCLP